MTATGIVGPNAPGAGSPTSVVRSPGYLITVATVPLTEIFSARVSLGFDLQVGQAVVQVPVLTAQMVMWAYVTIKLYASTAVGVITSFEGWITEIDYTLWPRSVGLVCSGLLIRADTKHNPAVAGTDLVGANGATDQSIVTAVLNACGLVMGAGPGYVNGTIGGTGVTLGAFARQNFLWAEGESGLAYIQRLDEVCLGYRTFDDVAGQINRKLISVVPTASPVATFTEGLDIESGTTQETVTAIRNRVVVTGYDQGLGGGPSTSSAQQISNFIPTVFGAAQYVSQQVSSPLIERALAADPGPGLSCEDVATYTLTQTNRKQTKTTFVTPRDDVISPGDTIAIHGAAGVADRLGVHTTFWVQNIERELTEKGAFSQTLTCLSGVV